MPEALYMAAPSSPTDGHAAYGGGRSSAASAADAAPAARRRRCYPFSEKRLAANRANARRSTGPRTRLGKERARLNAVRHGLRAALPAGQTPEIARALGEDSSEFRSLHLGFFEELRPQNGVERQIVERAARAAWRLRRADAMEVELIEQAVAERIGTGGLRAGPDLPAFAIFMAEQFRAPRGSPLLRLADYQSRLQSGFHRALRELCRLRDEQAKGRDGAGRGGVVLSTVAGLGEQAQQQAPGTNEPIAEAAPSPRQPEEPKPVTADGSRSTARAGSVPKCLPFDANTDRTHRSPILPSRIPRAAHAPRGPPAPQPALEVAYKQESDEPASGSPLTSHRRLSSFSRGRMSSPVPNGLLPAAAAVQPSSVRHCPGHALPNPRCALWPG
jgi:hypothetical protein